MCNVLEEAMPAAGLLPRKEMTAIPSNVRRTLLMPRATFFSATNIEREFSGLRAAYVSAKSQRSQLKS